MHFNIYFLKLYTEWVTSHFAVHKNNFKILDTYVTYSLNCVTVTTLSLSTSSATTQSNKTPNVHKATYQTQHSVYDAVIFCQGVSTYVMFSTLLSHPLLISFRILFWVTSLNGSNFVIIWPLWGQHSSATNLHITVSFIWPAFYVYIFKSYVSWHS
jgi:hypothetical protein